MRLLTCFTALLVALIAGCGGDSAPAANSAAPASAVSSNQSTTTAASQDAAVQQPATPEVPVTLPVQPESSPNDVVIAFLNAMRDGNSGVAAALMTEQARAETAKHQWPVHPPGAPSATYQTGEAVYVDANKTGVHIPCLWTEPDGSGGTVQFEVTWALRSSQDGWRVAGFATEVVPGKAPYYFNFEDIENLKQTQAAAESDMAAALAAQSPPAEVAEKPTQPAQ